MPQWRLAAELRIGEARQGPQYEFSRILAVLPAADGSMFIADTRAQEIRVFGPSGVYLRTIGRSGQGPGEFTRLHAIGFLGDTLWAIDGRLRRTSLFSRDGQVLLTIPIEAAASGQAGWINHLNALLPDGAALGRASADRMEALGGPALPVPLLRMTRSGKTIDTVAWVATKNEVFSLPTDGGGFTFGVQRFSDAPLTILAPAASRLFVIDRSVAEGPRNARFRVVALKANGDTLWNRDYPYVPRRMESASIDSFLTAVQRSAARSGHTAAQVKQAVFLPEFRTPVNSGFVAADGALWLRREEAAITSYSIINPLGDLVADVSLPGNVTLFAVTGSKAWGVETDSDDVPHVVRYGLIR